MLLAFSFGLRPPCFSRERAAEMAASCLGVSGCEHGRLLCRFPFGVLSWGCGAGIMGCSRRDGWLAGSGACGSFRRESEESDRLVRG